MVFCICSYLLYYIRLVSIISIVCLFHDDYGDDYYYDDDDNDDDYDNDDYDNDNHNDYDYEDDYEYLDSSSNIRP